MTIRLFKQRIFYAVSAASALMLMGLVALALYLVIARGIPALSFSFALQPMAEGGLSGGVRHQMIGSLILLITTLVLVVPVALSIAIVHTVYLRESSVQKSLSLILHVLNGIPSIIFGLFGFFVFVKFLGWGKSWFTGGILLSMMILPTVALTLSEGMRRIPHEYIENARSLGLSKEQMVISILIPQSASSFLSGLLLGLVRAVGETAPIMFTATVFSGATVPNGIVDNPVLSLPYHIFTLTQESYQAKAVQNAWGSACLLLLIVFGLNALATPFRMNAFEEIKTA